ncbi:cytochrome P450 [Lentzea sp. NBRC 102530]|uniref:cytochrome P450 n=1 Tax=Lentzea sp. NBRC 102530 TaxID=3032201 RepID=UPI0024A1CE13|nr:cytochrome P450 [Lentzea sp. NBRC 102530]GLY47826.1 cytochrome P450 [Lentzea sp. NBRC 102530]
MAIASRFDTVRVFGTVLLPTIAKGAVVRRPRVMALAEKLRSDATAIATMRALRDRYGPEPLRLRVTGRSLALLLDPADVGRLLAESPEPFSIATKEKNAALEHFQPHGLIVTRGPHRRQLREFNETVLRPPNIPAEEVVRDEGDLLVRHARSTGELTWHALNQAWWRIVRRLVLGNAARQDDQLTDALKALRQRANWAYLSPRAEAAQDRFRRRLRAHLDRREAGSLAATAEPEQLVEQVPHWLFAFDAAGIVLMRALAIGGTGARGVLESARLWPTTPLLLRESTEHTRWHGTLLPTGTSFVVFTPFFHRDPDRLPFADRYAPEIWDGPRDPAIVPFSAGPGECPGRDLVLTAAGTLLDVLTEHLDLPVLSAPLPATLNHFGLRLPVTAAGDRVRG